MTTRVSGRAADELRLLTFTRDFTEMATGSVLVEFGRTRVLCTASLETRVPPWLKNSGKGWVTAEYSMLPGSSAERVTRSGDDPGSIEYSAVTQPLPEFFSHGGTLLSSEAVHSTRVRPKETRTEPAAASV